MKWYVENALSNFPFWSGAKDRVEMLTSDQLDEIGEALERDVWQDEIPEDVKINDLFWHDFAFCCSLIGLIYASDGNVYESREDWAEAVVDANFPDIEEGEFEDFIEYVGSDIDYWDSDSEIIEAFEDYLNRGDDEDDNEED